MYTCAYTYLCTMYICIPIVHFRLLMGVIFRTSNILSWGSLNRKSPAGLRGKASVLWCNTIECNKDHNNLWCWSRGQRGQSARQCGCNLLASRVSSRRFYRRGCRTLFAAEESPHDPAGRHGVGARHINTCILRARRGVCEAKTTRVRECGSTNTQWSFLSAFARST